MALILFFVFLLTSSVAATTDLTAFVYETCSNNQTIQNQTLQNQPALDWLFITLISQSSTTNFFQTSVANITGLYQCRSDLSHTQCNTCVERLTNTIQTSCYTSRAQLAGCYMRYEVGVYHIDYRPVNGLWHKKCGVRAGTGTDFDMIKNDALKVLVNSVGNKGHFAMSFLYDSPASDTDATGHVFGQCEGDLGGDDCVDCVQTAVEFAQAECGSSFDADVYLEKCYISYSDGGDRDGGHARGLVALMLATIVFVLL